jgi:flagellar biosynthesis/type III secretory pathway protein FliH
MNAGAGADVRTRDAQAPRGSAHSFPSLAALKRKREQNEEEIHQSRVAEEFEKARKDGYESGYQNGINAARAEAAKLYENARNEGRERGMAEGKAEAARTIEALKGVSRELARLHKGSVAELESFSIEFCLGLLKRLTGANALRKAFLAKAVREAVVALKPGGSQVVILSPSDIELLEGLLNGLNVKEDPLLAPGAFRVECGPLFVEGSLSAAMAQVERAMVRKKPSKAASD